MSANNKVLKKIMWYIDVEFVSPVSIHSGENNKTDQDILLDYKGDPFIPGSSLAGAMRAYLNYPKTEPCIFGYEVVNEDEDQDSDQREEVTGRMSSLYVSDLIFETKPTEPSVVIRDGVGLTDGKTAETGAKFDMQAVDTGAKGYFILELIIREENDEYEESKMINQLISALQGFNKHEIRLGAKKTRGYGELEITAVRRRDYTKENISTYIDAYDIEKAREQLNDISSTIFQESDNGEFVSLKVPLVLTGPISIRQYASQKDEPDYVHITANGHAVVPGTSFAGAIRHRIKEILSQMGIKNVEKVISMMFGYVDKDSGQAQRSNVIISESIIDGATPLTMVRTGISRFESSAKNAALYKELSQVGGKLTLEIQIRKNDDSDKDDEIDWMIGLLILAIKDIENGYLPIGGETSIGRGIFALDKQRIQNGIAYLDGTPVDKETEDNYLEDILIGIRRAGSC